ncbi:MAG: ribonuclease III [Oscillospiraceae bacterium]|nr:ribonuclease III [Oscillospiraceae bacterium]
MLSKLEQALSYTFKNKQLLKNALTHSSYANENRASKCPDNERLEFLGDSILGFVIADALYQQFPDKPEGELTRIRADLVCEGNLARVAATIHLGDALLLGHGEANSGGRKRDSIVSDAMESVLAAVYLDGGFDAAKAIILRLILGDVPEDKPRVIDYKTLFQELVQQTKNQAIHYVLVGESGPDHDKHFKMEAILNGKIVGKGSGSSKKRAEQEAARDAIEHLYPDQL